jgi:sialate O-acetylesterase
MKKNSWIVVIFLLLQVLHVNAAIVLPRFISDGMVLQRNSSIPVWGWANPAEKITLSFKGKVYTTVAGKDKKWKIFLKAEKAGGPYEMVVSGTNSIHIKNILIGDVWFCSGQSNMEYELYKSGEKYAKEIATSTNDQIRHFLVKRKVDFNQNEDVLSDKGWQSANPATVLNFTAVGYFYARKLFEKYHVPVGLINCSYGGTPAEAWMNENELKDFSGIYAKALEYKDSTLVKTIAAKDKVFTDNWYKQINEADIGTREKWFDPAAEFSLWNKMQLPNYWQDMGLADVDAGIVWFKKEIDIPSYLLGKNAVLKLGNIIQRESTYFNGTAVGSSSNKYVFRKYAIDKNLLKAGKNVITVRVLNEAGKGGFIKDKTYQLEIGDTVINLTGAWYYKLSTSSKPLLRDDVTRFQDMGSSMYHGMLEPLIGYGIKGVIWYQGESNVSRAGDYHTLFSRLINSWRAEWKQGNFPFLYVQLANINLPKSEPGESKLAELQEAQQLTLSLPNTGMAVANDIGEWNDVHPQNKSDVGSRLFLLAQKLAYGDKKVVYSGPVYQSKKIKGNQIILNFSNTGSGLMVKGGGSLQYFSIADSTGKFVWAKAKISGTTVVVWNENIQHPVAVRYAWADNPVGANLYNQEGLPASCFRTDKK